jgi:hypothetical protein
MLPDFSQQSAETDCQDEKRGMLVRLFNHAKALGRDCLSHCIIIDDS